MRDREAELGQRFGEIAAHPALVAAEARDQHQVGEQRRRRSVSRRSSWTCAIAHAPRAARTSRMNSAARSGSTGVPGVAVDLQRRADDAAVGDLSTSATVACLTPVLASTGVSGSAFFTASRSLIAAASPVIAPETRMASGMQENTAVRARSAGRAGRANRRTRPRHCRAAPGRERPSRSR